MPSKRSTPTQTPTPMPAKRTRGKGRPLAVRIRTLFDRELLRLLKDGRPLIDAGGSPVMDEHGKPRYRPLDAATLKLIHERLGELERQNPSMGGHSLTQRERADQHFAQLARSGQPMPWETPKTVSDPSDDDDDAG